MFFGCLKFRFACQRKKNVDKRKRDNIKRWRDGLNHLLKNRREKGKSRKKIFFFLFVVTFLFIYVSLCMYISTKSFHMVTVFKLLSLQHLYIFEARSRVVIPHLSVLCIYI